MICKQCGGLGKPQCPQCNGNGQGPVIPLPGGFLNFSPCAVCGGTGRMTCPRCIGSGVDPDPDPIKPKPEDAFLGRWQTGVGVVVTVTRGTNDTFIAEMNGNPRLASVFIEGDGVEIRFLVTNTAAGLIEAKSVGGQIKGTFTMTDSVAFLGN
jgi:hypothetical protein